MKERLPARALRHLASVEYTVPQGALKPHPDKFSIPQFVRAWHAPPRCGPDNAAEHLKIPLELANEVRTRLHALRKFGHEFGYRLPTSDKPAEAYNIRGEDIGLAEQRQAMRVGIYARVHANSALRPEDHGRVCEHLCRDRAVWEELGQCAEFVQYYVDNPTYEGMFSRFESKRGKDRGGWAKGTRKPRQPYLTSGVARTPLRVPVQLPRRLEDLRVKFWENESMRYSPLSNDNTTRPSVPQFMRACYALGTNAEAAAGALGIPLEAVWHAARALNRAYGRKLLQKAYDYDLAWQQLQLRNATQRQQERLETYAKVVGRLGIFLRDPADRLLFAAHRCGPSWEDTGDPEIDLFHDCKWLCSNCDSLTVGDLDCTPQAPLGYCENCLTPLRRKT